MLNLDSSTNSFSVDERYKYSETDNPLTAKNFALSGKLTVDVFNKRTGYVVEFAYLSCTEYEELKQVYLDQFTNGEFLTMNEDNVPLVDIEVYLSIPNETELRFTKNHVKKFKIVLEPKNPDILFGVS